MMRAEVNLTPFPLAESYERKRGELQALEIACWGGK